jgi:hypothetical protein
MQERVNKGDFQGKRQKKGGVWVKYWADDKFLLGFIAK